MGITISAQECEILSMFHAYGKDAGTIGELRGIKYNGEYDETYFYFSTFSDTVVLKDDVEYISKYPDIINPVMMILDGDLKLKDALECKDCHFTTIEPIEDGYVVVIRYYKEDGFEFLTDSKNAEEEPDFPYGNILYVINTDFEIVSKLDIIKGRGSSQQQLDKIEDDILFSGTFYPPYMLIRGDTIWEHDTYMGGGDPFPQPFQIFTLRYDYRADSVKWVQSIGAGGVDNFMDAVVDHESNVLITGRGSGQLIVEQDTLWDSEFGRTLPYVVKLDKDGGLLKLFNTPDIPGDMFTDMVVDDMGNIYIDSHSFDGQYINADTMVTHEVNDNLLMILKYTPDFEFDWVWFLTGDFEDAGANIAIDAKQRKIIYGGLIHSADGVGTIYQIGEEELEAPAGEFIDEWWTPNNVLTNFLAVLDLEGQALNGFNINSDPHDRLLLRNLSFTRDGDVLLQLEYPSTLLSDTWDFMGNEIELKGISDKRNDFIIKLPASVLSKMTSTTQSVFRKEEVLVYPNPVYHQDDVNILFGTRLRGQEAEISLMDINGRLIKREIKRIDQSHHIFDLGADTETGSYILNIKMGEEQISKKVIVMKE